jgi:hypothetical protein
MGKLECGVPTMGVTNGSDQYVEQMREFVVLGVAANEMVVLCLSAALLVNSMICCCRPERKCVSVVTGQQRSGLCGNPPGNLSHVRWKMPK